MKALIFANGKAKDGAMVRRALAAASDSRLIAADGGARIAWRFGLQPQVVIGDMDSLSEQELETLRTHGAEIRTYPAEKNETDLELALLYAAEERSTWIRIFGAIGGRFDQMLANVYLLALPQLDGLDVAMVARKQMIRLLKAGNYAFHGEVGDTFSLIPISGDVQGVRTEGLKYPLKGEMLYFGHARGVSNVLAKTDATVSLDEGLLLAVHTMGRA